MNLYDLFREVIEKGELMEEKIRILIADDTAIAREGLIRLLSDTPDIEIVGQAPNIFAVISSVKELKPDVLLLDLKWFGDETVGISAIDAVLQGSPKTRILAMTVYDQLIAQARAAGAHLAITKDFSRDQLLDQIRGLFKGGDLLPVHINNRPETKLEEPLTDREKDVLALMAEGLSDREIAEKLIISLNTEKNHVQSILGKLAAENRTRAVIVALRMGLISDQANRRQLKS